MELDPKYVDVIVQRCQDFSGQSAALEDGEDNEDNGRRDQLRQLDV